MVYSKKRSMLINGAFVELLMHAGNWESTREVISWLEAKQSDPLNFSTALY